MVFLLLSLSGNPSREGYPVLLGTFSSLTWTRFLDPEPGWDEQMNSEGQDWEGWGRRKELQLVGLWSHPQTWLLVKLLNPQSAWCKWISYPTEAAALRQCVWGKEQKQLTQTHKHLAETLGGEPLGNYRNGGRPEDPPDIWVPVLLVLLLFILFF